MPQASVEYSHLGKEAVAAAQSPMYPYEAQGRHDGNEGFLLNMSALHERNTHTPIRMSPMGWHT